MYLLRLTLSAAVCCLACVQLYYSSPLRSFLKTEDVVSVVHLRLQWVHTSLQTYWPVLHQQVWQPNPLLSHSHGIRWFQTDHALLSTGA